MKTSCIVFVFLILLLGLESCSPPSQPEQYPIVIFQNVAVLDLNQRELLQNRTVVVENGIISSIGEVRISDIPGRVVDGTGLTLMPGLTDMHVHLEWFPSPDILPFFLLHGVTFVRQMDGRLDHLVWRDEVFDGKLPGPFIYAGGTIIEGPNPLWDDTRVVKTVEEAKEAVRSQHRDGFDFIKVYHTLPGDLYEAIMAEAGDLGISVAGHVPGEPGLLGVLEGDQETVEHLGGFIRALKMEGSTPVPELHYLGYLYFGVEIDPAKQKEIIKKTGESGIMVVPTLSVQRQFLNAVRDENPPLPYESEFPKAAFGFWLGTHGYLREKFGETGIAAGEAGYVRKLNFLNSLYLEGVPLLIGTDTPQPFVFPGLSVHQEMHEFSRAGIANIDILEFATKSPSKLVDDFPGGGEISVGGMANFILVEGNPLDDLAVLKNVRGVMVGKTWLTKEEILDLIKRPKGGPFN